MGLPSVLASARPKAGPASQATVRTVPNTATSAELEAGWRNGARPVEGDGDLAKDVDEEPEPPEPEPDLYGPIGRVAEAVAEVAGLHAPAVYGALLAELGTAMGFGPHVELGGAVHRANTWVVVVAPSGGGKGDTTSAVAAVVDAIDPALPRSGGIGSGPALIDEFYEEVPDADHKLTTYELAGDRRLLLRYDELADLLGAASGSAAHRLSENLRAAWDGIQLDARARTVGKRTVPAGDHVVGLVAAVTVADLTEGMSSRLLRNGFGGRIIWVPQPAMALRLPVPRAKVVAAAGSEVAEAMLRARDVGRVDYTAEAFAWISERFDKLRAQAAGDAVAEALVARWPAQTLRIGIALCALDGSDRFDGALAEAAGSFTEPCLARAIGLFGVGGEVSMARRAMAAESAPAGTAAAVSSDADRILAKVAIGEFVTEGELARRFGSKQRSEMDLADALDKVARRGYLRRDSDERGEQRKVLRKGWRRVR